MEVVPNGTTYCESLGTLLKVAISCFGDSMGARSFTAMLATKSVTLTFDKSILIN